MKVLGNAAALLAAVSIMVGLIVAQHNYQNSWSEPNSIQTSATTVADTGTLEGAGGHTVVMR
jgi:hypothetical protein